MSAAEEAGIKQSDAVIASQTLVEHGFPVNTPEGQVLVTEKGRDEDNDSETFEGEDGTLERSSHDPMVLQPQGTAAAEAEAQAQAAEPPKQQRQAAPKQDS